MKRARRAFFVDREVQGNLVWRVLLYWHFFFISISLLLLAREMYSTPELSIGEILRAMLIRYSPVLFASLVVLPIVMLDLVHITNRVAGPVLRLRRSLCDMAEGRSVEPLSFREYDFWRGLAADFNRAIAAHRAAPAQADGADSAGG